METDYEALKVFETKVFVLNDEITYDGSQLKALWSYRNHGIQGNSVVVFEGPINVHKDEMVDVKDIRREEHLSDILIRSDRAINFIIEQFDQPPNLLLMYHRLQLISIIAKELIHEQLGITIRRDGSDLYHNGKKLSVGIATVSLTSGKIHCALNITSTGGPEYVPIIGLMDLGLEEENIKEFGKQIATRYAMEIMELTSDVSKTRPII